MGVKKYRTREGDFYKIDVWIENPDGTQQRYRQSRIPTREQAKMMVAKVQSEAYEGRFFDKRKECKLTVETLWNTYEHTTKEQNRSWKSDRSYAKHLIRILGMQRVEKLTLMAIENYRRQRRGETTKRGGPPSVGQLDREIELLRRMCNYAVKCNLLALSPLKGISLLDPKNKTNIRQVVIDETKFQMLHDVIEYPFDVVLVMAFDTGMRPEEILRIRREHVDLRDGVIRLSPIDTKEEDHRVIYLTERVLKALRSVPHNLHSPWVFTNPKTKRPYGNFRKRFATACQSVGIPYGMKDGIVFRDFRRSFVTKATRAGIRESVVMRMSGHKTREVFKRYNIVEEEDLQSARTLLEKSQDASCGRVLDTVEKKRNVS